jgi:toxin ParE1/3/4
MQVVWIKFAVLELLSVREYIRQEKPAAAERTGAKIEASVDSLAWFPEMCHPGKVPSTRELVISTIPCFVDYRLKGYTVQILRVLHDKQKWPPTS